MSLRLVLFVALVWALTCPASSQTPITSQISLSDHARRLDLNSASAQELEQLPGIGPARAQAILQYRERSAFKKGADLQKIRGIGTKTWATLRPLVCAGKECAAPEARP